jgi:lauroyl/myristoyl acyltransferase
MRRHLADPERRADSISAMAELLKRAALTAFPRDQVARLTGPAWFTFLDCTGRTTVFAALLADFRPVHLLPLNPLSNHQQRPAGDHR